MPLMSADRRSLSPSSGNSDSEQFRREHVHLQTRRHFLRDCQLGLGAAALSSLLGDGQAAAATGVVNPLAPRLPHFAAKAKQVIYLHLTGSPPHLDLYD